MKNHHHNGPVQSSSPNARSAIHDAIATRAHELWVGYGYPENQAEAIWLQAEQELLTGRKLPGSDPVLPVSF